MFRKLIAACVGLAMMGMAGTANAVPLEHTITFTCCTAGSDPGLTTGSFSVESTTLVAGAFTPSLVAFSATATGLGATWTFADDLVEGIGGGGRGTHVFARWIGGDGTGDDYIRHRRGRAHGARIEFDRRRIPVALAAVYGAGYGGAHRVRPLDHGTG